MDKNRIKSVYARQVMDCKLRPMVEVDVITEDGVLGRGSAPTGTSVECTKPLSCVTTICHDSMV